MEVKADRRSTDVTSARPRLAFPNLPDTLLALPRTGPTSHLSHKVLVSQESAAKRLKPPNRKAEQFTLPTTPALSARRLANLGSLRLTDTASSSLVVLLSARETRRDGILKGLMRERKAPPPPLERDDGERALQELKATGDPEFRLPTADGTLFPHAASPLKTPTATPIDEQAWTPLPKEQERSFATPPTPSQVRQDSVRRSFRWSIEEIKEAQAEACKWNVLPELEEPEPEINRQATILQTLWEDAQITSGIRESDILGTDSRESLETAAHSAEITASLNYLNFVRRLCGLPKVQPSPSKQLACSILCQALLPRSIKAAKQRSDDAKPKPKASPKPKSSAALRFAVPSLQVAQELNELKNSVLILQGEGSLVSALEDGFGALHLCHPDLGETHEAVEVAQHICAGVPYVPTAIPTPPEMTWLISGDTSRAEEEFPQALSQLKVFWHLDPACPAPKTGRRSKSKATPRRPVEPPNQAKLFGLHAIWGDRKGFLTSRRALLSPKLQSFAAARSDDTCVLWLGPDGCLEKWEDVQGESTTLQAAGVHAVCYPPAGFVPLSLMEGPNMPWTVIPDALRFQPTSSTAVRVFHVRIERHDGSEEPVRLQEVSVKHMAVDCNGESFCVIFWPDLGHAHPGLQLEVEISGLRGDHEQLAIFHEFMTFRRKDGDHALLAEAANFRHLVHQAEPLWTCGGLKEASVQDQSQIEPLSHLGREITVDSNDLVLTLRCYAASLWATLMVKRFDGEFTEVERACHCIKLRDHIFLVGVKLPLPRHYYELKFSASLLGSPREVQPSLLRYFINTSGKCSAIVRSLDDRMMEKYGFVKVQIGAQLHGVTIIAPCKFRVPVGQIYFLMHVDRSVALQAARDAMPPVYSSVKKQETDSDSMARLFAERLRPTQDFRSPKEVRMMQEALQSEVSASVQETYGDIHLDLMLHNGQHIQRLRERQELPGLFEGLVTISDLDVSTKIQLVIRFPKIHACDFSPRRVAEWVVSRSQDRVHENF